MAWIAALLDSRTALSIWRRSLPRSQVRLHPCRSARELEHALQTRLIETIVLGPRAAGQVEIGGLRARYPVIPILIFGRLRPEDAEALLQWDRAEVGPVLVEGVDDAVASEILLRHSASSRRLAARAEFPRMLRLTERLQLRAWDRLAGSAGRPPRIAPLARSLGVSREHLSRQFGAGGAPNLKRVSDLLSVQAALELLTNPGYPVATVARLLEFASPSHLRTVVKRVTGARLEQARQLGHRELLRRFLRLSGGPD